MSQPHRVLHGGQKAKNAIGFIIIALLWGLSSLPGHAKADIPQLVRSVFTIQAEGGSGSGFLADENGLIISNAHVVRDSSYLAAVFADDQGRRRAKYPLTLLAMDTSSDIAILRVHPDAVRDVPAMQLADTEAIEALPLGRQLLALGSPLGTEGLLSSGVLGKVRAEVILSDVNINSGNSGGPLIDAETGAVVGINTFRIVESVGQGVSGSVRIDQAVKLLARARAGLGRKGAQPSAEQLPMQPNTTVSSDELREHVVRMKKLRRRDYRVEAGKFEVQFITPVVMAHEEIEAEKRAAKQRKRHRGKARGKDGRAPEPYRVGKNFYEWRKYAGDYSAAVTLLAVPELWISTASWITTALLGYPVYTRLRFKADFDRMELWRAGERVEPYYPGRITQVVSHRGLTSILLLFLSYFVIDDIAYVGNYRYPVSAFAPGAELELRVWRQDKSRPKVIKIEERLRTQVWDDFARFTSAER